MSEPTLSTRDRIIDTAMDIVRDQGVVKLTLDEAAKCAGLSKGGVLYHFKTKDELIRGMLEAMILQHEEIQLAYYQREPEGPYRWVRAVVRTAYDSDGLAKDRVAAALMALVAVNPELQKTIQAHYEKWIARIRADSPNQMLAELICMAMDGQYFESILGLELCDTTEREQMQAYLLDLLKREDGALR
ncbi:TetR/AcrR family transcriptional regulator [Magnetospirillum aberrantis]|uniref:TetR/AcrR family transcriptional regulator n=1 Tax=Magnetospirillum aberrantis SpK TaxID=908842 RepID=A0A7C9QSM4_9PROT|nr:TetR family transcriptional regulator [Magnetospirillum aberrantis]NFV79565.1 TetR/AcrR family transcriptional regulator [Magnetospirillum aberrantis SpK]